MRDQPMLGEAAPVDNEKKAPTVHFRRVAAVQREALSERCAAPGIRGINN
jgi:hypothetical protein